MLISLCRIMNRLYDYRPVSLVVKTLLSVREAWGSNTGLVKSDTVSPTARTAATFFWSCVVQALNRGDGPGHSLHASAHHCE